MPWPAPPAPTPDVPSNLSPIAVQKFNPALGQTVEYDLRQWGFVGDGSDHTQRWLDMTNDLAARRKRGTRVIFPSGDFGLNNAVLARTTSAGKFIVEGQGGATRIFPTGGQGRALTIDGSGGGRPIEVRDLYLGYRNTDAAVDMPYSQPMLELTNAEYFEVSGVFALTLGCGTFVRLLNCFNGRMDNSYWDGNQYAVPIQFDADPTNEADTLVFESQNFQGAYGVLMNGLHQNQTESCRFVACKGVNTVGPQAAGNVPYEAALFAQANAGDNFIIVPSAAGNLNPGDTLFIDIAARSLGEVAKVVSAVPIPATNTVQVNLALPLQFTHPIANTVPVVRNGILFALPNFLLFDFDTCHAEAYDTAIQAGLGNILGIDNCEFSVARCLRVTGVSGVVMGRNWSQGVTWNNGAGPDTNHLLDVPSWSTLADTVLGSMLLNGPFFSKNGGPPIDIIAGAAGVQPLANYMAPPWTLGVQATQTLQLPPGTYDLEGRGGGSGGGAGGVSTAIGNQVGGGGGGAGAVAKQTIQRLVSDALTVTIGAGGNGGAAPSGNGIVGTDTTFVWASDGTTTTAQAAKVAGVGGAANSAATVAGGLYGSAPGPSGTTPTAPGAGGTATNSTGVRGASGVSRGGGGGGGGAPVSAGSGGQGGNAGSVGAGGGVQVANTGTVNGGAGGVAGANTGAGGGGGGGAAVGGAAGAGGAGGSGAAFITRTK